jgi:hypothetical protein
MGEGVDPTKMCQNLVDKVTQSRQLSAVVEPEVLVLFENWLEELESEVTSFVMRKKSSNPADIADGLGVSRSGAEFLITKLQREGKL